MPNAFIKREPRQQYIHLPLYPEEIAYVTKIGMEMGLDFAPALRLVINQHRLENMAKLPQDGQQADSLELDARLGELARQ